jgi:hypothetical protein
MTPAIKASVLAKILAIYSPVAVIFGAVVR